jgi:hypothetical protein
MDSAINNRRRHCVLLFADEGFFAGDKAHVGVLKSLITEDTGTIKGSFRMRSWPSTYLHLIPASNEE